MAGGWGVEEWGFALSLVLIVPTAAGLWYAVRAHRRSKLAIYIERWSKIVDDIISNIDGLEVKYKNVQDLKNLVRVTGYLHNVGTVDIDRQDVYSFPKMRLPEGSRWLEGACVAERSVANFEIDGRVAQLSWDIIKKRERIQFEALLEYHGPSESWKKVGEVLSVDSRIKNTDVDLLNDMFHTPRPVFNFLNVFMLLPMLLIYLMLGFLTSSPGRELVGAFNPDGSLAGYAQLSPRGGVCIQPIKIDWASLDAEDCVDIRSGAGSNLTVPGFELKPTKRNYTEVFSPVYLFLGGFSIILFTLLIWESLSNYMYNRTYLNRMKWFSWTGRTAEHGSLRGGIGE